jgi:hypothetical protein
MLKDKMKATGKVVVCLRGPDGKIKDRQTVRNLVVTTGREHIADQLSGILQAAMSHMAIGLGDGAGGFTPAVLGDTVLQSELDRKVFTSKEQGTGGDSNKIVYITEWPAGEGTGAITEAGIFNAASGGVMMCRNGFDVKNKGVGDSLTLTWTITITS